MKKLFTILALAGAILGYAISKASCRHSAGRPLKTKGLSI